MKKSINLFSPTSIDLLDIGIGFAGIKLASPPTAKANRTEQLLHSKHSSPCEACLSLTGAK